MFLPRVCISVLILLILATGWKAFNQAIPYSRNPFWSLVYKVYPEIETKLSGLGFHSSRQNFLIGKLRDDSRATLGEIETRLRQAGFENAIIAWKDPGQILSLRKFDGRDHQFHIRVFNDGEVRIHRELSTEAHPLGHAIEADLVSGEDYFLPLLRDLITERDNK